MAEEPEVIQQDLEDTRHALAEKLEQIGEKISGTVDTVSETVSSVTESVANVTEAMEGTVQAVAESVSGTVESVKDTMSAMGEKASETVEAVKQAFNLPEQIRQRPWLWVGGSVAVGFIAGKILVPHRHHTTEASTFARGSGYHPAESQVTQPSYTNGRNQERRDEEPAAESSGASGIGSLLGGLTEQFGPELNKVKEMAVGALFGVLRDMVVQAVPSALKDQLQGVFNDFTEKAGGKPIQGTVLDEPAQHAGPEQGGNDAERNPTEMDRPLGTAERKGKAAVGQSNR
jgi:ElaB/YqjD/DUF883 family membrane-anchored ribosome-binding protein